MKSDKDIAFALGGLAGNNAHGAGFLQAAIETGVEPGMISFSSGQILWVLRYLQEKMHKKHEPNLRKLLEEDIKKIATTRNYDVDTALLFLFGVSDVYRPAFPEFFSDLLSNGAHFFDSILNKWPHAFITRELFESVPGRLLAPQFPDSFFKDISEAFNDETSMGLIFNSFDPTTGTELVYLNKTAEKLDAASKSKYRWRTDYCEITPSALRDALRLYEYGFDADYHGHLDGAYYRQIMLSELASATDIFVARPIKYKWIGRRLPTGLAGIEDLKTKVGFNGSYAGERDKIKLINKLIDDGALNGDRYKKINLIEIEMELHRGYFDYIYESLEVFDSAYKCAQGKFQELALGAS
jgi:hypothetical protein